MTGYVGRWAPYADQGYVGHFGGVRFANAPLPAIPGWRVAVQAYSANQDQHAITFVRGDCSATVALTGLERLMNRRRPLKQLLAARLRAVLAA